VQPWIPPQAPKQQTRTVYVDKKPPGSAPVWWVMALAVAQLLAVLVWIWIVYSHATNGTEQGKNMAIAICSLGTVIAVVVLAAVNVTQLILVVVALVRGAVASGIAAMILAALIAAAAWAGVLVGCQLALIQGF
jgi:hypothetical protein